MNDNIKYKIGYAAGYAEGILLVAFAAYGAYSLAKLGRDWFKFGVEVVKEYKGIEN